MAAGCQRCAEERTDFSRGWRAEHGHNQLRRHLLLSKVKEDRGGTSKSVPAYQRRNHRSSLHAADRQGRR